MYLYYVNSIDEYNYIDGSYIREAQDATPIREAQDATSIREAQDAMLSALLTSCPPACRRAGRIQLPSKRRATRSSSGKAKCCSTKERNSRAVGESRWTGRQAKQRVCSGAPLRSSRRRIRRCAAAGEASSAGETGPATDAPECPVAVSPPGASPAVLKGESGAWQGVASAFDAERHVVPFCLAARSSSQWLGASANPTPSPAPMSRC